jgi:hypothetical protein
LLKRLLPQRTFTLLIVPDSGAGIRSIRISLSKLKLPLLSLLLLPTLMFTALLLLPGTLRHWLDPFHLVQENAQLRARVKSLDDDMGRLRRRLVESSALEARVRALAGLTPIDPEVRRMGVGGPDFSSRDPLFHLHPDAAAEVNEVSRNVDQLLSQAELQRFSFLEIVESLEQRREEWAHLPSISPVSAGEVTSGFGRRLDPFTEASSFHRGIDVSAARGTPILGTAAGRVVFAGKNEGYGLTLRIDHGNGIETMYAHVLDLKVRRGDRVVRGQEVARVGTTGRTTAPHVHYEVRVNGRAVNPHTYLLPVGEIVD